MHFFHPIQQCAQQIYHTALPLSPTSSHLQKSCLQSVADDQLSHVITFVGAPSTWGLLLRTIDIRPREVTCIATSGQQIIAGCGDIVNIYDAVTGVLQQPLSPSEEVKKIQASPDGSTLFFAHSLSITTWDVQTGGLAYTFTVQSEVKDILLSMTGDYIACSFHDSVTLCNTRNKQEGKGFRSDQPVVVMCWVSPQKLAIATQNSICIHSVTTGETLDSLSFHDRVWGMVYLTDKDGFLVGTSKPGPQANQELCSFETISHRRPDPLERKLSTMHRGRLVRRKIHREKLSPTHPGPLTHLTIVGKEIACITPPSGVQSFSTESNDWTNKPPLLDAAESVAVSLNRNLVVQTKDSIQIFSIDALTSHDAPDRVHLSHFYPLGKEYILYLQPDRHLTLLNLETLREIQPNDEFLPFGSLSYDLLGYASRTPSRSVNPGLPEAIQSWKQGIPIPESSRLVSGQVPQDLCVLSPGCAIMLSVTAGCVQVIDAKHGFILAVLNDVGDLGGRKVYDISFDSETRFHLKVGGLDGRFKIPCDIEPRAPSSLAFLDYPLLVTKGQPEPLSEAQATQPYTLDANCEWVLDAKSRKICWISPGNVRRGDGGHVWGGATLTMVGGDGVVRKVTFKEPDC
jgi:WD40 repeat protein